MQERSPADQTWMLVSQPQIHLLLFCFSSCDDSGFIPVYSFPQKCIVSSHHILLITQNTQQKLSSNQGFFKETAHSPAQLSPFSRLITPFPQNIPVGWLSAIVLGHFTPPGGARNGPLGGSLSSLNLLGPSITSSLFAPQGFCTSCFLC